MASVNIEGLGKRLGDTTVLHPTDLAIADGEFMVVIGPSGCGKATLLRLVAGIVVVQHAGRVSGDASDRTDALEERRQQRIDRHSLKSG